MEFRSDRTGLISFGQSQTASACKYGKEFSGFIKYGDFFFEQLGTSQVLKKGYEQVACTITTAILLFLRFTVTITYLHC